MLDDKGLQELSDVYLAATEVVLKRGFATGLECGTTMLALALKIIQECLSPEDFKAFVKEIPQSAQLIIPQTKPGSVH